MSDLRDRVFEVLTGPMPNPGFGARAYMTLARWSEGSPEEVAQALRYVAALVQEGRRLSSRDYMTFRRCEENLSMQIANDEGVDLEAVRQEVRAIVDPGQLLEDPA